MATHRAQRTPSGLLSLLVVTPEPEFLETGVVSGGEIAGLEDGENVLETTFKKGQDSEALDDGVALLDTGGRGVATIGQQLMQAGVVLRLLNHLTKVEKLVG